VFEKNRRTVLAASMLGCRGKVQRESGVIHLIVEHTHDMTEELKLVSGLDGVFPLVPGRGDEVKRGGGSDPRDNKGHAPKPRDIYVPDLHLDSLKVKAQKSFCRRCTGVNETK
jgi:error-prone DNA polymerase